MIAGERRFDGLRLERFLFELILLDFREELVECFFLYKIFLMELFALKFIEMVDVGCFGDGEQLGFSDKIVHEIFK